MSDRFINFFLYLFVLLGFIGGVYGASLLLISCVFFILIILFAKYWNKYAFFRLKVNKNLSRSRTDFGKKLYYSIEFHNRKILPLIWLRIEEYINDNFEFTADNLLRKALGKNMNILRDSISLKWFEKVKRNYEIIPHQRGLFNFGKGSIYFNGLLGLYQNKIEVSNSEELIVYPRIVPLKFFDIKESHIFGSSPRKGWIYKDPLNKVGVRPYQSTDSIKDINWKASARHMQLESNIYEPSYNKEIHIFLYSPGSNYWWEEQSKEKLELSIICAASLVDKSIQKDLPVGFYSNLLSSRRLNKNYIEIQCDKNIKQRDKILTALALIQPFSNKKAGNLMLEQQNKIRKGATVIVITIEISEYLKRVLNKYNKSYNLKVIKLGEKTKQKMKNIETYYVKEEGPWDEIENLEMV